MDVPTESQLLEAGITVYQWCAFMTSCANWFLIYALDSGYSYEWKAKAVLSNFNFARQCSVYPYTSFCVLLY